MSAAAQPGAGVWVPGGRGMLGQAVVAALQARGYTPQATGSELDVADADAVARFAEAQPCATWVNCAAMTAVDACEDGGAGAAKNDAVNARAPEVLARAARRCGARLAHVSTDYVFAGDASAAYDEGAPCAPKTAYGRAKLRGEQALWQALGAEAHLGYVVRTAWLFGPGGPNFVATMLRLMRERTRVEVVDDQRGRPTYAPDLAVALLDLLGLRGPRAHGNEARAAAAGTYHFANAGEVSWHGFAEAILRHARQRGLELTCREVAATDSARFPRPAPRPAYSVLATHKVSTALGTAPRPFDAALADYFDTLST